MAKAAKKTAEEARCEEAGQEGQEVTFASAPSRFVASVPAAETATIMTGSNRVSDHSKKSFPATAEASHFCPIFCAGLVIHRRPPCFPPAKSGQSTLVQ